MAVDGEKVRAIRWTLTPTPRVPEGEYAIECVKTFSVKEQFGQPRLQVAFRIVRGPYRGAMPEYREYEDADLPGESPCRREIPMYFTLDMDNDGTIIVRPRSKYAKLLRLVLSQEGLARGVPTPDVLLGKRFQAEVVTVTMDFQRKPLPEEDRYSKVGKILRMLDE